MPAEHGVSGDFYLLTNGPHATNIAVVGDVCGHGPLAAQRATFARATLASVAASCEDPGEILHLVNRSLIDHSDDLDFLTATCIAHDPRAQIVRWSTAGHPVPIRLSDLTELNGHSSAPLGVDAGTEFATRSARLDPEDAVLLYTDGLLDAVGPGRERYGEGRLRAALAGCAAGTAAQVTQALARSVARFAGGRFADDVCIVVLRAERLSPPASPGPASGARATPA
jgi:serine phosphatase RsbU (regulator of sigma subunit)